MAECDEPSFLAALSLMNSGMEADDGSNKTFFAIMGSINRLAGQPPAKSGFEQVRNGAVEVTQIPVCRELQSARLD